MHIRLDQFEIQRLANILANWFLKEGTKLNLKKRTFVRLCFG